MNIVSVTAWQIFDSRGVPTVEAKVVLEDGSVGHGVAPSGASTGQFESLELRDRDPARFRGKSVFRAIGHIEREIAQRVIGQNAFDQRGIDGLLIALDGTPDRSRLGANALLPVSMAVARAAAAAKGVPLFHYLGNGLGRLIPVPEIQIIGGGAHANWRTDVQDYLLIATGATSFDEVMEVTHNVYHAAGDLLKKQGKDAGVADEGGYWPAFETNEQAIQLIVEAIEAAGYTPGKDASIALDIAASDLFDEPTRQYRFKLEGVAFDSSAFVDLMVRWCDHYPIVSIEDPLADTDWTGWQRITQALGSRIQLVGDDLFTTNIPRIREGMSRNVANAVLIKPNQVGTVTETLDAIRVTQEHGWQPIVSARSGETEDAFISHLAVATNAGQLKVGSFARSERMVKWNELIRIARGLGADARFQQFASTH